MSYIVKFIASSVLIVGIGFTNLANADRYERHMPYDYSNNHGDHRKIIKHPANQPYHAHVDKHKPKKNVVVHKPIYQKPRHEVENDKLKNAALIGITAAVIFNILN